MGYRIVYGPMPKTVEAGRRCSYRLYWLTALFLMLLVLLVKLYWPEGVQVLRSCLLPGEMTSTEQAVNGLISDLQGGESFGDAVTVFCRQILENAR